MKLYLLLMLISISNFCCGQRDDLAVFRSYVFSIVEDSTNYWSEYPKPPKLTDDVLQGMMQEIGKDDSAKYFLNRLSFSKFKSHQDAETAFEYINRMDYTYSLLALAAHWSPDVRLKALIHLNTKISIRPLVNSVKMKNGEWEKFDNIAIAFLVYLLESNPIFIPGSENSTIHNNYISNITWNLDLLTGENIADKQNISGWYKNDLQFEQAVLKWKSLVK